MNKDIVSLMFAQLDSIRPFAQNLEPKNLNLALPRIESTKSIISPSHAIPSEEIRYIIHTIHCNCAQEAALIHPIRTVKRVPPSLLYVPSVATAIFLCILLKNPGETLQREFIADIPSFSLMTFVKRPKRPSHVWRYGTDE